MREIARALRDLGVMAASPEGREVIAEEFERVIRRSRVGGVMLDRARLMHDYLRDPDEPIQPKLLIGAALLYLAIPSDLIPDWFAFVGFADDFAALAYVWHNLRDVLANYEQRRRLRMELAEEAI